jgi:hypothetical protein
MRKSALLLVFAVLLVLISVSSVSAWYGDYDYRISYNTSKFTENQPFVLNGSNGILINSNKQIGFVLYNISLTDYYTYFDDETNIIAVANDGVNDTQIPIEWEIGNSSSYNNQSVYDANFKMVQHHKDNSSIGLKDSTSNNMNGVGRNIYSQNGLIGGAIYYNGLYDAATNSNVSYGNNPIGPAENLTIEVWFNYTDNGRFGNLLSTFKGVAGTIDDYILIIDSSSTLTNVYFERQTNTTESVSGWVEGFFKFGSYYHYVMVSNNTHLMLYVNSTLKYTVAFTNSAHTATTQAIFNGQFLANNGNAYQGQIDELRLSNVARSQSYITQTYNNVLGTSGYGTAGALEEPPPPSGEAVVTAHITSPTIVYPNIDFKFNMTATDSDNATINGYVQFYVNGTVSGTAQSQAMTNNTNTLIGTLSHSSFGLGSTLIAEYWASDGINTTAKANHSTVTVTSGAPNIPVLVSPANNLISEVNAVNLSVTVTDNQGDVMNVSFYNTTNWNVTSAVYFQSFLVSTHDTGMYGLYFKPDGTKMYFVGNTNDKVYEYDLSTIWDVSSATYLQEFDISAQDGHPYGLYFKPDGTKMYFVGQDNDRVYEYNLPIAWNVTSAVYLQSSSVLVDGNSAGLFFKPDGTKIYFVGYFNNKVYEYNLPIAWNVTSAVYLQNVSISIQNINSAGLFFKPDGTKIYSIDNGNQKIFEYNLPIAWNVTSAVYLQSSPILSDNSPIGLYFKSNGVKAYFIGLTGGRVYEYNLGTSTLLNTTTNIANGSTATYEWTNLADGVYNWYAVVTDGYESNTSSVWTFSIDTTAPQITLNPSNAFTATNTSTINNYNSTTFPINITFADERDLFAAEINITNATGYTMFNWTNISSISGLSYTYNNTLNNTAWTAGLYIINIIVSDSHTSMLTGDYELTKQKDELIFETPEANKITIEAVNAISSGTIKKGDRYQFEFSYPDTIKDTLVYNIESDNEIYYRPDSGYKAHFVIWNPRTKTGNWVDFEDSTLKDYTVQKVDDKHYTITFSIPAGIETVTFNSIGGLNVVTESYSWYRGLTSQSYTSPVLTNISTSFYLNATNTSIISDINARFFYNYTEYTVTKTTSADYGFKATVTTPSVALGSQNFNFTWNVSVNQTDGTQYNFSEINTQTISTAQINVTIRDEIELYLINNETFNIYVINKGRYYTTTTGYVLIGNLSAGVPYIEIENANYPRRGYYITISENLTTYLTAYILRSSPSTQEVVFTIQNSGLTKIEDAKMTFYRIVNMTYVEVGQIQTDYAGQTALTLDTTNEYRIVIEATGYPIKTLELRPIQTSYIITLQETGAGFVNYFEGIAYTITPVNRTFNVSQNYTNFRLDIYSSNSDLEVFGLRTFDHTYTCVPASCATNVTGSPSGGSAVVQVIGNVTGAVKVDVFFKRTGYDLVYLNYNIYSFVNMITANIRSMWRLMNDFKTRYSPIMLALIAIIGTIVLLGTAAEIGVYGLPLIVIAAFGLIFFAVIGFLNPLVVGLSLILGGVVYFRFSGGGD